MMAFGSIVLASALIVTVALAQAQPVNNQMMKNAADLGQDSPALVPKGRDAYLIMKAYNALVDAGKALETLIELHEVSESKTQSKRNGEGDWEFMRFGKK